METNAKQFASVSSEYFPSVSSGYFPSASWPLSETDRREPSIPPNPLPSFSCYQLTKGDAATPAIHVAEDTERPDERLGKLLLGILNRGIGDLYISPETTRIIYTFANPATGRTRTFVFQMEPGEAAIDPRVHAAIARKLKVEYVMPNDDPATQEQIRAALVNPPVALYVVREDDSLSIVLPEPEKSSVDFARLYNSS